ncbi:MAG TPA: methionine--tRNA ligase [Vicinamibacterales bacterium]|nr:methionine--tRNA ligase [Vicinamibacterales bacterium]
MPRFYLTTPIYYVNAEPHLGHAYTTVVADAIARTRRLLGDDVFFLTGTDEHGQKVERAAKAKGMTPQAFTDAISIKFKELFAHLDVSNDDFIRTTEPRHIAAAQAIWRRVQERGFLYKATYEGWYCTVDEAFVPETQLVNGRCPECGGAVDRVSEESYFFKLSAFEKPLLDLYEQQPDFVTPDIRRNEVLSFVKSGLKDLSVSRTSFTWGVPVPDDPKHVMYVWFDALTNYITAVGFPDDTQRFDKYWPANLHLMGKEIVRFHTVYWPAFLMAAGLPLPKQIVGHGWWLMNDAKMSKSLGNVVRPQSYTKVFGVDAFRYFCLREMTLGHDANYSDEAFLTRYNADLANDLGNLVSRATTMVHRYCQGVIPEPDGAFEDSALTQQLRELIPLVQSRMGETYHFSLALRDIWDVIATTNKFIATKEPWALAKDPAKRGELNAVLYQSADVLRVVAGLIEPVMPNTAPRIRMMLGIEAQSWHQLQHERLWPGTPLGATEPLFPRIEKTVEELRHMADQENASAAATPGPFAPQVSTATATNTEPGTRNPEPATASGSERIGIDAFMNVELRTAKVLAAEAVPKSKKLIKLQVDLGTEQRTILAGIAEAYQPESLIGKTIVIVANLKPAKLMGIESNGMVLAASPEGGKPVLLTVEAEPGWRVR